MNESCNQEVLDDMRDDFRRRPATMDDGNTDVGVENLDLIFEETAVDNLTTTMLMKPKSLEESL